MGGHKDSDVQLRVTKGLHMSCPLCGGRQALGAIWVQSDE